MMKPMHGVPYGLELDHATPISPAASSATQSPTTSLLTTPFVSPEPGYIASKEAALIITREILTEYHHAVDADISQVHDSSLAQISPTALATVNAFLDRILLNVLATSRSISLANLRPAVREVLKPRLAQEAISGADEELIECIGEDDEIDLFEDATEILDGQWDLDLVWKRARLRCMVYTRLGDMEEEDEDRHIAANGLDSYLEGKRISRSSGPVSPPVAIWLTAILEFIGENVLMVATQTAYKRCETRYGRGLAGQSLPPRVVLVSDSDMDKIALNPTLGRLWRAWRKPIQSPKVGISRALSIDSVGHRRLDSRSTGFTKKPSSDTMHSPRRGSDSEPVNKDALPETDPAAVPLPASANSVEDDVLESSASIVDRPRHSWNRVRPQSMLIPKMGDGQTVSSDASVSHPRPQRSRSLPQARWSSVYPDYEHVRVSGAVTSQTGQTPSSSLSLADQDASGYNSSQGGVFSSLRGSSDYQIPSDTPQTGSLRTSKKKRASYQPGNDRKSGVSEFGGPDGPVLFDRSDYLVDSHESRGTDPHVTAATPTDPSEPVEARSGLRENRPNALAIASSGMLAAPTQPFSGDVSPIGEADFLDSGEVSPLEPSDDEGSISIHGLSDAQKHMGLASSSNQERPETPAYEEQQHQPQVVSPISPPAEERPTQIHGLEEAPATNRHALSATVPAALAEAAVAAATIANQARDGENMIRRDSGERRREAFIAPQSHQASDSTERVAPLNVPKDEQLDKLAAAAKAHANVAVPQPENIYRSMSSDLPRNATPPMSAMQSSVSPPAIAPLQLESSSPGLSASPPTSKLLERRRQLPHVDTTVPERAAVQRLTPSPQSANGSIKRTPPRSVPEPLYSGRASGSSAHKSASTKASRSGDEIAKSGIAAENVLQRQSHTSSRSSSADKSKDFEQLIDSGETIQYTLTPQNIRSYKAPEIATTGASSRPVLTERNPSYSGSNGLPTAKSRSSTTAFAGTPVRIPAAATPTSESRTNVAKKSGLAPRDAKMDNTSTKDFADFMRNTGPVPDGASRTPLSKAVSMSNVHAPRLVPNTGITEKLTTASIPGLVRRPSNLSAGMTQTPRSAAVGTSKKTGPKLIARDAQTSARGTSDLIDFIREGPPPESGAHRIAGSVAPSRTTLDSEDMRGGSTARGRGYAGSMNSTQESFKTNSGMSSVNSHTGLLASTRGSGNAMRGLAEEPMMPTRKSRKPRDPYAIETDDEDEDEDEGEEDQRPNAGRLAARRGGGEESLLDFLSSTAQPSESIGGSGGAAASARKPLVGAGGGAGQGTTGGAARSSSAPLLPRSANATTTGGVSSLGRPIGVPGGAARPRANLQAREATSARRTETMDLADFLKNSGPPPGRIVPLGKGVDAAADKKEKQGRFGKMFGNKKTRS